MTNFQSLGFVTEDLASSQKSYCLISSCNEFLSRRHDVNLNVFFEDCFIPCVEPKFARFNVKDAYIFQGHLIATSLKSISSVKNFPTKNKYFYVQDLENLRSGSNKEEWQSIISDPNIIKFCRSEDHLDKLSQYQNVSEQVVVDFNIEQILGVINDSKTTEK